MGMRSDRDSDFDYEAEDRSYRGGGRKQEDYYASRERGPAEEAERDYPMQHRNRQLDEDVYGSRERDEDYNDRKFLGTRGSGRSNFRNTNYRDADFRETEVNSRGGGGDLYRDLDRDRKVMDDDRYERMNWGADSYGSSRTRDDDYRSRDSREDLGYEDDRIESVRDDYHDREEIRARGSSFGRDDFRSQDEEGYRNDYRTRDNLSGLSGGYGRNTTRESIRNERDHRGGSGRGGGRNR
jgi:hypothetical protein